VTRDFTWRDGERIVRFGTGALADAPALLGDRYTLLTTERTEALAPEVVAGAASVHHVASGRVDDIAGDLLDVVEGDLLVALGGGRVIDVTKALASARAVDAAAIPTTLSAAEMTRGGRPARGADPKAARVRPRIVVNDPAVSASQPDKELAASTANALGHAIEGVLTPQRSPVPTLAAIESVRLLNRADREALALGALLAGYVIDSAGYGLHHVLAQTLARFAGVWHGHANAAMLPHAIVALRLRDEAMLRTLDEAAGEPLEAVARRLAQRAGAQRLRDLGVTEAALETCVEQALQRPDLAQTPPAADEAEVRALYEAAW
jgi:alcohol dehydrogenase class IV